jgi:ABC-type branched-subunit amino acid transport system substrate-binding protein
MNTNTLFKFSTNSLRLGALCISGLLVALGAVVACSSDNTNGGTVDQGDGGPPAITEAGADTAPNCPPAPTRACTAKQCTQQLGEPAVCVKDACVKLKSPECPVVIGPADDDSALLIGGVHDLFGGLKTVGQASYNAHELAIKEINDKGGLRDPDRCKPSRPLVLVGCNESNVNPDGTTYVAPDGGAPDGGPAELTRQQRVIDHLAKDLDIPIITGGDSSGNSLALNNYLQPNYQRLYLTTRSTSPVFENPTTFNASPNGTRLFWRVTGNAKGQTAAMRLVLAQVAEAAKAKYTLSKVKVALVAKNDAFGQGTADAFDTGLTINGAAAGGTNVNADYLRLNFRERPGVGQPSQLEQQDALAQLKAFLPDIIVFIATDEFVNGTVGVSNPLNTGFLKPYEDYVAANNLQKPYYLHSHASNSSAFSAYLNNFANFASDPLVRKNFLDRNRGTNVYEPTALAAAFFGRYKASYQTPTELLYGMSESYDGTYIAAYLYGATFWKPEPVTSEVLAKAFPSLVEGASTVDNGPIAFTSAIQTLTTGGKINYNGAVSPFEWDYKTGEAPYNTNIWCVQVNASTGTLFFQQNAGQIWKYATNTLEGTYSCPN